jgi:hypothetical protein
MAFHGLIRSTDRAQDKVVRPTSRDLVRSLYTITDFRPLPFRAHLVADLTFDTQIEASVAA